MIEDIVKAIPIGIGISFMIGPVFFMLIQTSILKSARAAIVFNLGVVLADIVFLLLAYYGSHQILSKIKDDPKLFFIGGLILFIYGVGMYLKKENRTPIQQETFATPIKKNYVGLILKGFLLNFINIGLLAFWLLMVLGISPSLEMDEHRIFTFFTTIIITYYITDLGKILLAKQLKKKLTPNVIRKINRAIGIVLIIFGVLLFLKGIIPQKTLNIKNFIEHFQN